VIGGPGAFMVPVNDWDQFAEAVRRKLVLEIGDAYAEALEGGGAAHHSKAQFVLEEPYDCLIGERIWQQCAVGSSTIPGLGTGAVEPEVEDRRKVSRDAG
jgi:hypothetical protein